MALVAYSDDSDLGTDTEENEEACEIREVKKIGQGEKSQDKRHPPPKPYSETPKHETVLNEGIDNIVEDEEKGLKNEKNKDKNYPSNNLNSEKQKTTPTNTNPVKQKTETATNEGIDSIVDEDEDVIIPKVSGGMFAAIPKAVPLNNNTELIQDDDLTDVPTVETWKVTQELKKSNNDGVPSKKSKSENSLMNKKKERKKVQFFVPALSEFEEEEEEEEEPKQKKTVQPSSSGSGLFSLLPDPKHLAVKAPKRSLVPNVLTKRPAPTPTPPRKKKPKKEINTVSEDVSDEEDTAGPSDFFSLSEPAFDISQHPSQIYQPEVQSRLYHPEANKDQRAVAASGSQPSVMVNEEPQGAVEVQPDIMLHNEVQGVQAYRSQAEIDAEAMVRLAGKRRGKGEVINFIDVSADDALLTRQEWMTKALTEEKPTHGFSKKREGLPSQKQKQKHQITYLAHQAKERELELKNNWAQNKMTKMQTQAKYGF